MDIRQGSHRGCLALLKLKRFTARVLILVFILTTKYHLSKLQKSSFRIEYKLKRNASITNCQLTSNSIVFGQRTFFSIIKLVFREKHQYYLFYYNLIFKCCVLFISLGKPINSNWFKMSCLAWLVLSCVYCFFLKRWNYIKILVLHEQAVLLPNFFSHRWRHKSLKNTIDLLLFYGNHSYGFPESVM